MQILLGDFHGFYYVKLSIFGLNNLFMILMLKVD